MSTVSNDLFARLLCHSPLTSIMSLYRYEVVNLITKNYCNWAGLAAWTWPVWQYLGLPRSFVGPVLGREALVKGYSALVSVERCYARRVRKAYCSQVF
jgi:hypothetical protein